MFGLIPKVIWNKFVPVDTDNMSVWGTNCLLFQAGKKKVLIETGVGSKLNPKQQKIYGRSNQNFFERNLKKAGLSFEDIDVVIPTHLHMDHAGGFTDFHGKDLKPRFPKAKYFIQREEWEAATHPNRLSRGSYLSENFLPIVDAHCEEWLDGDSEILPGIEVFKTGAHTHGHQVVKISSEGQTLFCGGDLIPARWFVRQTFLTCYDLSPIQVMECKTRWLEQAKQENWMLHWYHDHEMPFGKVDIEGENFIPKPL